MSIIETLKLTPAEVEQIVAEYCRTALLSRLHRRTPSDDGKKKLPLTESSGRRPLITPSSRRYAICTGVAKWPSGVVSPPEAIIMNTAFPGASSFRVSAVFAR